MTKPSARRRAWFIAGASCTPFLAALPAWSQEDFASQLKALRAQVETQTHELEVQRESLQAQGQLLHDQAAEIQALKAHASEAAEPSEALTTFRGRGLDPQGLGAGSADPQAASAQPAPSEAAPAQSAPAQASPPQASPDQPAQTAQDAQAAPAQAAPAAAAAAATVQASTVQAAAAAETAAAQPMPADQPPPGAPPPIQPVGEAPPPTPSQAAAATVTQALPEFMGVLTSPGHWVVEPQFEYLHTSNNELVFRGVQIVPGLQIGLIDATTAERELVSGALDVRTGVTNRFELEVRVPYVYIHDETTTLNQQSTTETVTETTGNADLGDVELIGRYQINSSHNSNAIWVASLDVKSDTGLGPYDVSYDKFGVAQKQSTGSGFWSLEPAVSVLYPSDPVVLFASIGYIYSISRNFNRDITSNVKVGWVNPGGSPVAAVGFAFALNDRFSFSLGYKQSYIRPTSTELNGVWTTSLPLQIGVSTFGMSYRVTPKINLSDNFEFGVTRDAPDVHLLTRLTFFF